MEPGDRRLRGHHGELVLRSRDGHHEIISNGVMLMDTRNGVSETVLVRRALQAVPGASSILIGGLGVGFSLAEALRADVPHITVVECEREIIRWNRTTTGAVTGGSVADPNVRCVHADLVGWLDRTDARFDVICLDIDNGPSWTVSHANADLYSHRGLVALGDRLHDGGAVSFWSADRSRPFERRLARLFANVERIDVPVPRGPPDVVHVATGYHGAAAPLGAAEHVPPA